MVGSTNGNIKTKIPSSSKKRYIARNANLRNVNGLGVYSIYASLNFHLIFDLIIKNKRLKILGKINTATIDTIIPIKASNKLLESGSNPVNGIISLSPFKINLYPLNFRY